MLVCVGVRGQCVVLSSLQVGPRGWTQFVRLGCKPPLGAEPSNWTSVFFFFFLVFGACDVCLRPMRHSAHADVRGQLSPFDSLLPGIKLTCCAGTLWEIFLTLGIWGTSENWLSLRLCFCLLAFWLLSAMDLFASEGAAHISRGHLSSYGNLQSFLLRVSLF